MNKYKFIEEVDNNLIINNQEWKINERIVGSSVGGIAPSGQLMGVLEKIDIIDGWIGLSDKFW